MIAIDMVTTKNNCVLFDLARIVENRLKIEGYPKLSIKWHGREIMPLIYHQSTMYECV